MLWKAEVMSKYIKPKPKQIISMRWLPKQNTGKKKKKRSKKSFLTRIWNIKPVKSLRPMDDEDTERALREAMALLGRQYEFLSSAWTAEEAGDVPLLEPLCKGWTKGISLNCNKATCPDGSQLQSVEELKDEIAKLLTLMHSILKPALCLKTFVLDMRHLFSG